MLALPYSVRVGGDCRLATYSIIYPLLGENAEWCLRGANDAVEYYEMVEGEHEKLMLTFEWEWLKKYFESKYKQTQ